MDYLEYMHNSSKYYDPRKIEFGAIKQLSGGIRNKKFLDLGCGTGRHSFVLAEGGAKVEAIDINKSFIGYCTSQAHKGIRFRVGDAKKLPYKNKSFDVVLASWLLSTVRKYPEDMHSILAESKRVLKDDGIIITIDGDSGSEYGGVLKKFLKPGYLTAIDYMKELRNAFVLNFGNIQSHKNYKIPYVFPNMDIAKEIFDFELQSLRKSYPERILKQKIISLLSHYKIGGKKVKIQESVTIHASLKQPAGKWLLET